MTGVSARRQDIVFGSGGVGRVVAVDCRMRRGRRVEPVLCETRHLSALQQLQHAQRQPVSIHAADWRRQRQIAISLRTAQHLQVAASPSGVLQQRAVSDQRPPMCVTRRHHVRNTLRLNSTTRARPDPHGLCRRLARTNGVSRRSGSFGSGRARVVEFSQYQTKSADIVWSGPVGSV